MKNNILDKFRAGERSFGTFSGLDSTIAAECLAIADLDYVIIDCEHSSIGRSDVGDYVSILKAKGVTPIVRINSQSKSSIQWSLDLGAGGILVPRIETPEQVRELAKLSKYPPMGVRGFGPARESGFMHDKKFQADGIPSWMAEMNASEMVIPQCETVGCLENIEEIVSIDGIDAIMVGPYDLSIAMGIAGQFTKPEFIAALRRVQKACADAGKPSIIFTANPDSIKEYYDMGYNSVIYSVDTFAVVQYFRAIAASIR